MRITTKGRYALRAVIALSGASSPESPLSIRSISGQEGISAEFLEQIFFKLRRAGIVKSVRGPGGGFYLARPLAEISLLEVLEASGEGLGIAPCSCGASALEDCGRDRDCAARHVWDKVDNHLRDYVSRVSIAELIG